MQLTTDDVGYGALPHVFRAPRIGREHVKQNLLSTPAILTKVGMCTLLKKDLLEAISWHAQQQNVTEVAYGFCFARDLVLLVPLL